MIFKVHNFVNNCQSCPYNISLLPSALVLHTLPSILVLLQTFRKALEDKFDCIHVISFNLRNICSSMIQLMEDSRALQR